MYIYNSILNHNRQYHRKATQKISNTANISSRPMQRIFLYHLFKVQILSEDSARRQEFCNWAIDIYCVDIKTFSDCYFYRLGKIPLKWICHITFTTMTRKTLTVFHTRSRSFIVPKKSWVTMWLGATFIRNIFTKFPILTEL